MLSGVQCINQNIFFKVLKKYFEDENIRNFIKDHIFGVFFS